jgi:hypothetical protein
VKPIKKLGLLVVAAIAAMAVVGAGTAMATGTTTLCKENKTPCPEAQRYGAGTLVEGLSTNPVLLGTFFGFVGSVSCEHSIVSGKLNSSIGTPLSGKIENITFTGNCKSTFGGSCTVTTVKKGTLDLLRTAANLGTATSLGNEVLIKCTGFINMDCVFGGTPQLHAEGSPVKHLTANEAVLVPVSGTGCPSNPRWDALYKITQPTGNLFISS